MSALSTANVAQSEPKGIDRLFAELSGAYGSKFADMWSGVDAAQVKSVWVCGLGGLTGEEIAKGLELCITTKPFPPTMPEFRNLCRPVLDMHSMLLVAIREMAHRRNREQENWPNNRLFWAAQRLAHELRSTEKPELLLKRFELAWFDAAGDADKPIPESSPENAIPAPAKSYLSKEEAKQRADQIGLHAKSIRKIGIQQQWAYDIADAPEKYEAPSIEAALKALKVFGVEWHEKLIERARVVGLVDLVGEEE